MKLRLVTLNAGLLSAFKGRVEFAPFVTERLAALPGELRRLNADIVALQEVYKQEHRELILAALHDVFPHYLYRRNRRNLGFENGLMTLSKVPIAGALTLFRDATVDERLLDNKGVLSCRMNLGGDASLTVLNLHTTAGSAFLHPEAPRVDRIRSRQITQVLAQAAAEGGVTILAGDLNAGPGVSDENFRQVLEAGYESAFDLLHPQDERVTWDPANRLNREGPHRSSPPQRIDHVFVRKTDLALARIRLVASEICCNEEIVFTGQGEKVTVSDHFGLQVDLEWGH
jgi:endonuclease/exonuclease/phosphatase family metal-dependent hydrolase